MRRALALLLAAALAAGCGGGPSNLIRNPRAYPGWARAARLLDAYRRIACPACVWTDWRLGLVRSEKVNAANAGNGVFLLTEPASRLPDGELDAAIAHEAAHEVAGHVWKRRAASAAITAAFMVVNVFLPGAGLLNRIVNPTVTRAYSREQELEADSIAVSLMGIRRGKPGGARDLIRLMERFRAARGAEGGGGTGLLDTHPHPGERIEALRRILDGTAAPLPVPAGYLPPRLREASGEAAAGDSGLPSGDPGDP